MKIKHEFELIERSELFDDKIYYNLLGNKVK